MRARGLWIVVGLVGALLLSDRLPARGDAATTPKYVLRVATVAPKGTMWARELQAWVDEVAKRTNGELKVKLYLGGTAGNELEVQQRMKKGQLDGAMSGGMLCLQVAPSMRVLRVIGVVQGREESEHLMREFMPSLQKEARANGYTLVSIGGLGSGVIFSRGPIRNMEELRKARLWRWDLDQVAITMEKSMGLDIVPLPLEAASQAYDDDKIDGFIAIPGATLAFQWFTHTRYMVDLNADFLAGCFLLTNDAVDELPKEYQEILQETGERLAARLEEVGRKQDDQLMNSTFQKKGLKLLPVSAQFRAEFFDATRAAREKLTNDLVPTDALDLTLQMLADYRAEHGTR